MKKDDVDTGVCYIAKVSGKEAVVKILFQSATGGWMARNLSTGRAIRVRGGQRLKRAATSEEIVKATENFK